MVGKLLGKFIFPVVLIISCLIVQAAPKIAIAGDSDKTREIAELVMADRSEKFEFLEREDIEKILREHKLSTSTISGIQLIDLFSVLHADLFVVLSSGRINKTTSPSSVKIFNAKNGFCLIDSALPKDLEPCVSQVCKKLTAAMKKFMNSKSFRQVSILAVRNSSVPVRYNRQLEHIAIRLERGLVAASDITILERTQLGLVNQERKITKKLYSLTPSAYLLDFEFLPTGNSDTVTLKIHILNTAGKEVHCLDFPDSLKLPSEHILKSLLKWLKSSSPVDHKVIVDEARRFYNEYIYYRQLNEYDVAKYKLETAIALNPGEPLYRYSLASYLASVVPKFDYQNFYSAETYMKWLGLLKQSMEIYDGIARDFPDYDKILYHDHYIRSQLSSIYVNKNPLTLRQLEEARKVFREWRSKALPQEQKFYWKYDLKDGINSKEEFIHLWDFQNRCCYMNYFACYQDYYDYSYDWTVKLLKVTGDYLRKYPELQRKKRRFTPSFWFRQENGGMDYWWEKLEKVQELIDLAKQHPDEKVRLYGGSLELIREMHKSKYDPKVFRRNLTVFVDKYKQVPDYIDFFIQALPRKKWGNLFYVVNDLRPPKPEKKSNINFCLTSHLEAEAIQFSCCYYEAARKARGEDKELYKNKTQGVFNSVKEFGGKLYLCMLHYHIDKKNPYSRDKFAAVSVYRYDPVTNDLKRLWTLDKFFMKTVPFERITTMLEVNKDYFLIACYDSIIVINRKNSKSIILKDFPGSRIRRLTVMNNRIYAVFGRSKNPSGSKVVETVLLSCRMDGSDRKIHISTLRKDKRNWFDRQKAFSVTGFSADEKRGRLLFTANRPLNGFYEFYPATGKGRKIGSFVQKISQSWSKQYGNTVFIADWNEYFYTYNIKTDRFKFIFYSGPLNQIKYFKQKPEYAVPLKYDHLSCGAPFIVAHGRIWFGLYIVNSVTLNKKLIVQAASWPEDIHFTPVGLAMNHAVALYPDPDGKFMLAISNNTIYQIKEVPTK